MDTADRHHDGTGTPVLHDGAHHRPVEVRVGSETFRLTPDAAAFLHASTAANTKRAYAGDFAHFTRWCRQTGCVALPAAPADIANYLAALAVGAGPASGGQRATATIKRRVAAIRLAHKAAGHVDPTGHVVVERTLAGIVRTLGSRQERAAPLTKDLVARAARAIGDGTPVARRDRALLLVGFAGAFRRSELVAITTDDLAFSDAGVLVSVRRSKTDQQGRGRVTAIPYLDGDPLLCPARSLTAWCDQAGIVAGPVFRGLTRTGEVRASALHDGEVSRIVKRAVEAIGLDPAGFSGHSLRAGFVTSARAEGVPDHVVMAQTGHSDPRSLSVYTRPDDLFATDPLGWLRWDEPAAG